MVFRYPFNTNMLLLLEVVVFGIEKKLDFKYDRPPPIVILHSVFSRMCVLSRPSFYTSSSVSFHNK